MAAGPCPFHLVPSRGLTQPLPIFVILLLLEAAALRFDYVAGVGDYLDLAGVP